MNYKMVMRFNEIEGELTKEELDEHIKNHIRDVNVQFTGYANDEDGNICGVEGYADLGHGYGFDNGFETFTVKFGETYSFTHEYTSVDGSSDWNDGSSEGVLKLIKIDD